MTVQDRHDQAPARCVPVVGVHPSAREERGP